MSLSRMSAGAVLLAVWLCANAGQIDSATFFALRAGMPESEVLLRAGPPDLVTTPGVEAVEFESARVGARGDVLETTRFLDAPEIRQLHYMPGPEEHDPHLTIITIRRGVVYEIERRKIFSPVYAPPQEPGPPTAPARSDTDLQRERVERTLEAAERYADVRARIKAREGAPPVAEPRPIYQGTDEHGSPYFGDVPPRTPEIEGAR